MAVIKLRGDVRAHKQGSFRQGHTFRNSSQRTKFFINFRARSSNMLLKKHALLLLWLLKLVFLSLKKVLKNLYKLQKQGSPLG